MQITHMDITTVDFGVIVHQVNCQGVMGSGVAKAIRDKWPQVFTSYYSKYQKFCIEGKSLLGEIDVCPINEHLFVVNLFGQEDFRQSVVTNKLRYTSYGAWEKALLALGQRMIMDGLPTEVYFPFNVACDRGGGDFRIISAMIEEYFPNAVFCKI